MQKSHSKYFCHPSGWIQTNIFTRWFENFIEIVKPTAEKPVLLILDGHYSHTRNTDVIDLARRNQITISSIPPHTSHKMQPLDVSYMSPLKANYSEEIRRFLKESARPVEMRDVVGIFGKAFKKTARYETSESGFRATGIYPVNRFVFQDNEFHNNKKDTLVVPVVSNPPDQPPTVDVQLSTSNAQLSTPNAVAPVPISSSTPITTASSTSTSESQNNISGTSSTSSSFVTPEEIAPIREVVKKKPTNRGRKATEASVITSSPYKTSLLISQSHQKEKEKSVPLSKKSKKQPARRGRPKKVVEPEAIPSTSNAEPELPTRPKRAVRVRHKLYEDIVASGSSSSESSASEDEVSLHDSSGSESDDDVNVACFYCNGKFLEDENNEKWVQCLQCKLWSHELCAGNEDGMFVCEFCL